MELVHIVMDAVLIFLLGADLIVFHRKDEARVAPSPKGSPVFLRRMSERRKPKVQDDHKAWEQEQKAPRE